MNESVVRTQFKRRLPLVTAACLLTLKAVAQAEFPVGTETGLLKLPVAPGAVRFGAGWAIPLVAARPDWFTAALERQVIKAGGKPVAAPGDAPLPSEIGIRPGAWMISPHGCTMNFIFQRNGEFLIGTAGHCVDQVGQGVVILTLGPGSSQPVLVDIGEVVAWRDNGVGDDFALVAIRPELSGWVSATTAVIGGPCGSYDGFGPETVAHYGHGAAIGTGGTPRGGVALTWDVDHFGWSSPAIFGDSGSPVRVLSMGAAGDLTHLVVDSAWLPSFVAGTRIQKMLQIMDGLALVSSPLCSLAEGSSFIRGDTNQDQRVDISDPVAILRTLFPVKALFLGEATFLCRDAADANDDGAVHLTDAIYLLSHVFLGGSPPGAPFPDLGPDPTPDALGDCK